MSVWLIQSKTWTFLHWHEQIFCTTEVCRCSSADCHQVFPAVNWHELTKRVPKLKHTHIFIHFWHNKIQITHTVGGRYQQTHCYILETVTYRALQFLHQEENNPDLDTLIRASKHQINLFNLHQLEKLHGVLSFKADVFSRGKTKQNKTKMLIHTGGIVEQEGVVGRQCSQIMALAL